MLADDISAGCPFVQLFYFSCGGTFGLVTTSGLAWNLTSWYLLFAYLLSFWPIEMFSGWKIWSKSFSHSMLMILVNSHISKCQKNKHIGAACVLILWCLDSESVRHSEPELDTAASPFPRTPCGHRSVMMEVLGAGVFVAPTNNISIMCHIRAISLRLHLKKSEEISPGKNCKNKKSRTNGLGVCSMYTN